MAKSLLFVNEAKKSMQKQANKLVMQLKPLSEVIKILRPDNPKLLDGKWKKDAKSIFNSMKEVLPHNALAMQS